MDAESEKPEMDLYCGPTSVGGLIMRIASAPLVWTDAKPTVEGWYWWRPANRQYMAGCIYIDEDGNMRLGEYRQPLSGQFAGPIPMPEEPR